jgi:succinate dehydrogenase cytochrome b subunit
MRVLQGFSTSVGSKILIGLTGLALVGFLIFHLAGNLLVFLGPASYNDHAHALISNPLVIPAELGLAAIFLVHVFKTIGHVLRGRAARPVRYNVKKWAGGASRKSLGSSTMIVSGLVTFAFVIVHLKTFKYGANYQVADQPAVRDLYRLLIEVFHRPADVVFYVICMIVIGLHLRHGISSAFQSIGVMPAGWTRAILASGLWLAVIIAFGFAVIPIAVYVFL